MKRSLLLLTLFSLSFIFHSCKVTKHKKHVYMEKAFAEIKESFPDATTTIVNDSIKIIFPNNVMFNTGSASILEGFSEKMIRFSTILDKYNNTKILITGHTDSEGDDEMNLSLSKERAENVKLNLNQNKIDKDRLFTWGLGEKSPIASNETEEGKALNRRVEFVILYESN